MIRDIMEHMTENGGGTTDCISTDMTSSRTPIPFGTNMTSIPMTTEVISAKILDAIASGDSFIIMLQVNQKPRPNIIQPSI